MNMKYRKSKISREVNIPIDGRKIRVHACFNVITRCSVYVKVGSYMEVNFGLLIVTVFIHFLILAGPF